MINNELRPYETYIDTGIDWLDKIPAHWEKISVRGITELSNKRCGNREDLELLSVYREYGVVRKNSRDDNHNVESLDLSSYKYVDKGYLVLNKMKMWQGSLGVSKYEGIVSPAYIVCKIKSDINLEYLHLLLRSPKFKTIYNRISYGVRVGQWDMRYDDFKKINFFAPPKLEQEQIVKYLNYQIEKINKFIKAKKKELVLIRELIDCETNRIISNDSTKWYRLKNTVNIAGKEIERVNNKEYVPIGLYNRGRGLFHKPSTMGVDLGDSSFFEVGDDYLIFSGQFAWEGAIAITTLDDVGCIASHRYPMVMGKSDILKSKYLWAFFVSKYGDHLLNLNSRGAAGRNRPLNINYLLKEKIPVPTMENQIEISRLVEEYHLLRNEIFKYVDLLSEYKNSLISDVVTGKVDVRNIVIDELEEETSEDIEIDEDSIDEESLEVEGGDE